MKILNYAVACMSVIMFGGCLNYTPPPIETESDTFTKQKKDPRIVLPPDTKVLTLDMAQELAIANNPSFESKYHAVQAAWDAYRQRFSSYMPTITADYGFSQNIGKPTDITNTTQYNTDSRTSSLGFNASLLVFDGLQREMKLLKARHEALGEESVREDARRLLLKSVAEAYNNILLQIENNRIAITDRDFQLKQLKDAQYKYDAGAVPLSDVLNFKVKVNQATSNQITAEYSYNAYRYLLASLMGITESSLPESLKYSPIDAIPEETLPDINIYLDMALNNRPDLRNYREALEAARYQLYTQWGAYSPNLYLNGGLGYSNNWNHYDNRSGNYPAARHSYYNDRTYNWSVNSEWVIFNGFSRELQIRQAQSQVYSAEFNVASMWITVIQEVRTAYDTYLQNVKQAKLFKETLQLVTKQRDLVEEEYKAGNKELTRLNEAQRDLVEAETNLVIALVNVMNARAQLDASTNSNQIGANSKKD